MSLHLLPTAHGTASQRAVLATYGDSSSEWLRAGQALQRLLLVGRARGCQPVDVPGVEGGTQPGEVPHVVVEDVCSRLLQPSVGRQDEGQGRWERVG
ncbi:hypothetical protein ETD83_27295 [Actinomadura soli]|uniref:Uncharacterized protein n=1 Tax=Actinomadura soli TaxID=2508997 RepID=A0A5C4J7J6_9ACTN|nr:hypothetical protein ETD83_27295 [Actinomadura soli]